MPPNAIVRSRSISEHCRYEQEPTGRDDDADQLDRRDIIAGMRGTQYREPERRNQHD